jgi:hypothetical protein
MKRWLVRLVLLGTVGGVAFWAWGCFFPSAERVIRKQLLALAKAASIAPNEGALTKLANTQRLTSFFAVDAQVTLEVPGRLLQTLNGRDDILNATGYARSMLNTLKIEFMDIIVQVGADRQSALAHLTATASLPGEKIPEVQELEITLHKTDQGWLIRRIEAVKTLR